MSSFAILISGRSEQPNVVRLAANEHALEVYATDGYVDNVPWWRLYRSGDDRSTHQFRRLDRRDWELRVTSGADRDLLAHIGRRPIHRILHPLRRLESLKVIAGIAVLLVTFAQHAPAEWLARTVPQWAQRRLVDGVVAQDAPRRCAHEGGEAVVRKLLVALDPTIGRGVDVVAIREGAFVVSSTPGNHIFMFRSSMAEIDPRALPALLAHELSHVRHNDPITAFIRNNGFLGTWAATLDGNAHGLLQMEFSGLEERRADIEAMQMMRRAGMPLKPAAQMFDAMRVSKEQGGYFGYDQRDFHFGIDGRAQRWAYWARSDPPHPDPALSSAEEDALFNFCWTGPIPPLPKGSQKAPATALPPGAGVLLPSETAPKHP